MIRRAQEHRELAGLRLGEQLLADASVEQGRRARRGRHGNEDPRAPPERVAERARVAVTQPQEAGVEAPEESRKQRGTNGRSAERARFRGTVRLEEPRAVGRHERHREDVRGRHREGDGQCQGPEQEASDSAEEDDRHEHDTGRDGRDQDRHRDLACALERSPGRRLAHREVALDVLDHHDGVVDQPPDRERDAAERHEVERFARGVEAEERDPDRQRDCEAHDDRRAERAEEEQDHERGQAGAEHALLLDRPDRPPDQHGLIHRQGQIDALGQLGQDVLERGLDAVDHGERVGARLPVDRQVDLSLAVHPHDVGLDLRAVPGLPDVAQEHRRVADHLDRHGVEIFDLRHHCIGDDLEIEVAELGIAGRDEDVLVAQGRHDIERRQVARCKLHGIDVGEDAAQLAAVDRGRDHARNALQSIAQIEVGDVVEPGLVEGGATDRDERERQRRRRIERHHHGRDRARRQVVEVSHRQ